MVRDGPISRDHGRLLTTLGDLRQQADYGYEPFEADVDELLRRPRDFVERVESLVEE